MATKEIPARRLPPPYYVSDAARAYLENYPPPAFPEYPGPHDHEGWRARIATLNAQFERFVGAAIDSATLDRVDMEQVEGVTIYRAAPLAAPASDQRVFLDIHGGGFFLMGGNGCRILTVLQMYRVAMPVVSVDYRMPPDHPFPAGLDDCVTVYEHLLKSHRPEQIIIGGSSAGGNLAAATILKARDIGLPLPAGAVLLTPETDLTERGDSFNTLEAIDPVLQSLMPVNLLYAAGTPLDDPYLSPQFADLSKGFPRTFIQSGTRDMLLSNSVNFHRALRRAGIDAHLHVWDGMPHAGFGGAPEDEEVAEEVRKFIAAC